MITEFVKNYRASSKGTILEEPIDFLFFRPCASVLVYFFKRTPITPNQISWMAFCISVIGGYYLSQGTDLGFKIGGISILLFAILDCSDGMLARIKKNGSEFGKLTDMIVDLLATLIYFICLSRGLAKDSSLAVMKYLPFVSGFFLYFHARNFYRYAQRYRRFLNPESHTLEQDIIHYQNKLKELKEAKAPFSKRWLIKLYLLFEESNLKDEKITFDPESYISSHKMTLPMWGLTAGSTHHLILGFGLINHSLIFYFFFSIFLANLWTILMVIIQNGVDSSLEKELM